MVDYRPHREGRSHVLDIALIGHAGAGFFLGDGAGVGKGRQIAGIIMDNYARGRRRAIWVSTSSDLHHDAERDLQDLGCGLSPPLLTIAQSKAISILKMALWGPGALGFEE